MVKDSQLVAYDDVKTESIKKISQALQDSKITNNVYHKWLNALGRLVSKVDENAPYFMQTRAYALKNLVTYLWSYTELKHDTLLYTKQPQMAELGWWWIWPCAIVVEAPDLPVPKWYIEADIDVIDELINLTKETSKYYDDTPYENLYKNFVQVLEKLKLMVLKPTFNFLKMVKSLQGSNGFVRDFKNSVKSLQQQVALLGMDHWYAMVY